MSKEQLFIQLVKQLSNEKLFHGHAVIDAEDEAMMVMMYVFNQSVNEILSTGATQVSIPQSKRALTFVQQRLNTQKPMAYILGVVTFAELTFISDERALVPRSPIAELILNNFNQYFDIKKVNTVLDLCTGSGCIGISISKYYKHIQCIISDISSKALSLANENINKHDVSVKSVKSDLFQLIDKHFDLIVTNPPYVSDAEYQQLPKEYKNEPKLGLVANKGGLEIPVQIMLDAPNYLNSGGHLILEVGYSDELLNEIFPQINFDWIDFSNGGQGVCVFTKKMLLEYQNYFKEFLETD